MKKVIAMILVGGKGTRLKEMTKSKAKPAISFGAKYRLIDFTLSNLSHSIIDTCGFITQYEPLELMSYIGNGASWDLDYTDGGVTFLTPYLKHDSIQWQKGTGHAVRQFYDFVEHHHPDYVMILPGDHIYKMDFNAMIEAMEIQNAEIMIATTRLDGDLSRFGIVEVDDANRVVAFEEKPDTPQSNLVSMGIYLFKKDILNELLFSPTELLDFGKDIIPEALKRGHRISAFEHTGYWRDVGTIQSLYDAHMEMLDHPEYLNLNQSGDLSIYSRSLNLKPHIVGMDGSVQSSVIADDCLINGTVIHSTVAYSVKIKKDAKVVDSCIMSQCHIGRGASLKKVIVNEGVIIPDHYVANHDHLTLITQDNIFEVGVVHE